MDSPVDRLTDDQLARVNAAHRWDSFTIDAKGRRVGNPDGRHYAIPHHHVTAADNLLRLKGREVTEFGCLEGAHTVELCRLARRVEAIDVRPENLVKTAVRTALYGCWPTLTLMDLEKDVPGAAEVFFHVGVLYHLKDPVHHLRRISARCHSLYLDTHYTTAPKQSYTSAAGGVHRCDDRSENVSEIRAGVRGVSRWITLDTILAVLRDYFPHVSVVSERDERNGPRCTVAAKGGPRA